MMLVSVSETSEPPAGELSISSHEVPLIRGPLRVYQKEIEFNLGGPPRDANILSRKWSRQENVSLLHIQNSTHLH